MAPDLLPRCADLIYQEAAYLDERRWSEWLALFTEDAEFWLPTWDEDAQPTNDPQSQLSLIYYNNRTGLEDRVWRIESGLSPASTPLARTCHLVTNVRITDVVDEQPHVSSHWQVHLYKPERQETLVIRSGANAQELFKWSRRTILLDQSAVAPLNFSIFLMTKILRSLIGAPG